MPNMYSNANKVPRKGDALYKQLERQLNYLDSSARLFDEGDHEEAIRMATTLRVMMHDGASPSLLTLMSLRDQLLFIDTGLYRDRLQAAGEAVAKSIDPELSNVGIIQGLAGLVEVGLNKDGSPGWVAPLAIERFPPGSTPHAALLAPQAFDAWWNTPLIEDSNFNQFSRRQLILVMANQDGGAHVDPSIDQHYENLMDDFLGMHVEFGGPDRTLDVEPINSPVSNNIAFASVRQIAFEAASTLNSHLSRTGYEAPSPFRTQEIFTLILGKYVDGS